MRSVYPEGAETLIESAQFPPALHTKTISTSPKKTKVQISNPRPGCSDVTSLRKAEQYVKRGMAHLDRERKILTFTDHANSTDRMIAAENLMIFQRRVAEIGYDAAAKERLGSLDELIQRMIKIPIAQPERALDIGKNSGGARPLRATIQGKPE